MTLGKAIMNAILIGWDGIVLTVEGRITEKEFLHEDNILCVCDCVCDCV